MKPDAIQQTKNKTKTPTFINDSTEQLTTTSTSQDFLQREKTILEYFSQNVSFHSFELEEKLQAGPPPELSKTQKLRWSSNINKKIQDEKEREENLLKNQAHFFAPAHKLLNDMVHRNKNLPEDATINQVTAAFTDCISNAKAVNTNKLITNPSDLPKEVNSLKILFEELSTCTAQTFTPEQAKDYTARYHKLGMEINSTTSRHLDEAGTMNPASCYVILYHCVTHMLQYHLNLMGITKVNSEEFSKLYALSAATGVSASAVVLNQDYQNCRKTHLEELSEKATKEKEIRNKEVILSSRKQYLYTGTNANSSASSWPLAPYAGFAESILGEKLSLLSDQELGLAIQRMEENLESNTVAVNIFYNNKKKEIPALAALQEIAISNILLNIGEDLLKLSLDPTSEILLNALTKFTNEHSEEFELYDNRLKQLKDMPPLNLLEAELSHIEITNLIFSHKKKEDFDNAATRLQQQAQKNIDIAKEIIAQKVTHKNKEDALLSFLKRNGSLILLTAPAVIFIETEHFLEYLNQFAPHVAYAERTLHKNINDAGIDTCWIRAISKYLSDSNISSDQETEELKKLKEIIDSNQNAFDEKTIALKRSSAQWQMLMQWLTDNITLSLNDFTQALDAFLLKDELKIEGNLTKEEYENGQATASPILLNKDSFSNVKLLRGKDLCQWSGFDGFLKDKEDAVITALEQVLKDELLPLTCLKNIHTLNDLELLPLQDFSRFLTLVRSNIAKALVEWKNIGGLHPQEVQGRLLKELICGNLTAENIHTYVTREETLIEKQLNADRLRFLSFMGGTSPTTGEIHYLHLKDTASTSISGDTSRAVRRKERFRIARDIWNNIRTENLEHLIHNNWLNAQGLSDPISYIIKNLNEVKKTLQKQAKNGDNTKYEQITKLIELIKPAQSLDCQHEFMLRGMEDELLSFTEAGESFTSHRNKEYNETLINLEKFAIPRYEELHKELKKIFGSHSDQVEIYYNKAKKMLAGLEPLDGSLPTEEQKKENIARFGVSSWSEALEEITKLAMPKNDALRLEADNAAAILEERRKQIESYKGGVLKPFTNLILQNQEAFQALMTGEKDGVLQYLSELEQYFRVPYEALRRYHPEGTFVKEFIIEKQNLFWDKTNNSLAFWKKEAENYYNAYSGFEIKGVSINSRYREISKKRKSLAPYLMQIIFADTEGISMLLNSTKKEQEEKLDAFEARITANNSSLETFLSAPQNNVTETLQKGFTMYLQTKIPFMESEDFQKNLPSWWKDYQDLDSITQKEVEKSTQVMNERAKLMLLIESKKQKGIEADQNVQSSIKEIESKLKYAPSPILLTLGQNKILNPIQLAAKKKEIQKKCSKQPVIIQDILLESSLIGTNWEQLSKEETWLASTYEKITNTAFTMGNSTIHIDGDVANELLMMVFVKLKLDIKDTGDAVLPEITEDVLQDTLRTLADSHRQLQELAQLKIKDTALLMERDHLVDTLTAGMYSMKKEDFDKLIAKRTSYIKASSIALTIFHEATAAYGNKQAALCSGLREYFHEELIREGELNIPTIREQTEKLLKDEYIRQFIISSNSLMEHMDHTDEVTMTSVHHTLDQKYDFESYLASSPYKEIFQAYTKLDLAQRQIFALALEIPGQEEELLPTTRFLKNEKVANATSIQIQEQLNRYINHETFTPIVDYTKALWHLKNPDGTVNKEAFQNAMDFTNVVTAKRLEQIPVDWDRLQDSVSTYTAAKSLMGQTANLAQLSIKDSEEFLQRLTTADTNEALSLKKELQTLTQHQLQILIHALTDRTVLDRTTKITAWDRAKGVLHEYVNSEKREELKSILIQDPSFVTKNAISSQMLSAAMASLMSYQLRDDITLTGRNIHKNDFADGALERKTVIDWTLLSEALTFVHEVEQETLRLNAISQADVLILESKNQAAIDEYKIQQQASLSSQEDFEKYLQAQAKKDNMAALYAGYLQLNKQERALFIKALTMRHILDISKNDIHLNRLGLAERDYADAQNRNILLNEYIKTSLTQGGLVELEEDSYRQAVYMTLSTQISDDVDFSEIKNNESLATYLTSFSNPFKSVRQTALDWKLIQRALQFVHRASNESDIFRQDRELYVSQGNLLNTGHFTFDSTHLRKNIHNSGNRFTRYLRRRVQDQLLDQIPAYMKPILKQSIRIGRANLSAKYADEFTKLGIFDDNEETSYIEKTSNLLEWEDSFYKDFFKKTAQQSLGKDTEKTFRDVMEGISDHLTYINATITTGQVIYNFYQLHDAENKAANASVEDLKQTEEATKHQTAEQQNLSEKAIVRNFNLQNQGRTKSKERQVDTIIDTVAEIIGTVAVEDDLLEIAVTEAGKLINFIRNYINDKSSVVKFFTDNGELEKMRSGYNDMTWDVEKENLDDIELIRQMKGYENYTELADFVGMNITRSLLFCASKYNPQKHLRYLAVATLATIDMTDAIGSQDAETSQMVFEALMGADYR